MIDFDARPVSAEILEAVRFSPKDRAEIRIRWIQGNRHRLQAGAQAGKINRQTKHVIDRY